MPWVLNDAPPNYQEELERCQYYLRPVNDFGQSNAVSVTAVKLNIRKPSNMRIPPTFTGPVYAASWAPQGYGTSNPNNITIASEDKDQLIVNVTGLGGQVSGENGVGLLLGWWDAQL